jgi:hypothetical protein
MKHGLEARATRDGRSPQAPHEEALGLGGDAHATVGMAGGTGPAAKR